MKHKHTIYSERSNKYLEVEKDSSPGPYSKAELISQALELKKKAIKEHYEREGKYVSHDEVCRKAAEIAEHRDKVFK